MRSPDARIAALASRQHGVARRDQLRAAGLSNAAISRRVDRGLLHRIFHAVYAVGHDALSREGWWMAGVLAAGEGAALSHLSAALLLGIWRGKAPECDVIAPRRTRAQPGLRIHACRRIDEMDVTIVRRIPVTTVPRTLVDLTDHLDAPQLANVIHEAAFRRIFNAHATHAAMTRANGRRNLAVLDGALRMHVSGSAGTRSTKEDDLRALVRAAGLPEPLANTPVLTAAGPIEVDFRRPEHHLCVELDGPGHDRPRTRREDRRRDALLRAAGERVIRIPLADLENRPDEAVALIARALPAPGHIPSS
jgi:very-short-patch-repair endonuclease